MKTRFLRLKYILNAKEKKSIILLMLMMIVIAVMEAFSIAAMIPVLIAFLNSSGSQINQESQTVFFQQVRQLRTLKQQELVLAAAPAVGLAKGRLVQNGTRQLDINQLHLAEKCTGELRAG